MTRSFGLVCGAVGALVLSVVVLGGCASGDGRVEPSGRVLAATAAETMGRLPPLTGRGVPISAITTNAPASSPVTIPIVLRPGDATDVHVDLGRVTRDGVTVSKRNIQTTSGHASDRAQSADVGLALSPKALKGTYGVWFRCVNEANASEMPWHYQEIVHPDDSDDSDGASELAGQVQ